MLQPLRAKAFCLSVGAFAPAKPASGVAGARGFAKAPGFSKSRNFSTKPEVRGILAAEGIQRFSR
jgi:hypothetical protein